MEKLSTVFYINSETLLQITIFRDRAYICLCKVVIGIAKNHMHTDFQQMQ